MNHTPARRDGHLSKPKTPRDRRVLMRRRSKICKKLQRTSNPVAKIGIENELVEIERKLQLSYEAEGTAVESKAVEAIKKNSKFFFRMPKK